MICDWCGHEHAITALCTESPRARGMNRRSFLFLSAAAAIGAALPIDPRAIQPIWAPLYEGTDLNGFFREVESRWVAQILTLKKQWRME